MFSITRFSQRIIGPTAVILIAALAVVTSRASSPPLQDRTSVALEAPAAAGPVLNYQGRLADPTTGDPKNGTFTMTFRLYGVATGGTALWTESKSVVVSNGQFSTLLGDTTSLNLTIFDGRDLWLGVQVGGDAEAIPRIQVANAPYALYSGNAAKLGGQLPGAFAVAGHTHLGEVWTHSANSNGLVLEGTVSWSNSLIRVINYSNGPSIWGINHGGGNAVRGEGSGDSLGVYGGAENAVGVAGRSSGHDGVNGVSTAFGRSGVYGYHEGTEQGYGVFGASEYGPGVWGRDAGPNTDDSWAVWADGDMRTTGDLSVELTMSIGGLATFNGGKSGFVVDIAQNDDTEPLLPGDVVSISGVGPPVLGEIPVIKVRRATADTATGVTGVVDGRFTLTVRAVASGTEADALEKTETTVETGPVAPGQYLTVVTLGAYKVIKVDANSGSISPGDLLVASPNPGHAMCSTAPQPGTIIGKSLGSLATGTGVVPVLITLQ